MLEKPDIQDAKIVTCLREQYGLHTAELVFLPLGADVNTAVYRAVTEGGTAFFVKLRAGTFDETSIRLSRLLADQSIAQIIPPLPGTRGRLWASLDAYKLVVYPFVAGRDGYQVSLSDRQWVELGAALKRIHSAPLPAALRHAIRQEGYAPHGRALVLAALEEVEQVDYEDPVAARVAALLRARRGDIVDLVRRADRLAQVLRARSLEPVLCHSDLHAGNVLITGDGRLFIVDWDEAILAPKERDLMYAGGGLMGGWRPPEEEEALFYQGYGPVHVDPAALAYYRYERIVQDIAAYCQQLLGSDQGGEDREQSLAYLASNWGPGHVLEIAYRSDRTGKENT